jgi:hypothetical protein
MPLLTPANVNNLAQRTRRYLRGVTTPPASLKEFWDRLPPKREDRSVWLFVFGPVLIAHGERWVYAARPPFALDDAPGYGWAERVNTVERQLRQALRDYPPRGGHDHVVVPVPAGVKDVRAHAIRTNADAARCFAGARLGRRPPTVTPPAPGSPAPRDAGC